MFAKEKGIEDVKVIDWGTSRAFNPEKRMKRLVGTVPTPFPP